MSNKVFWKLGEASPPELSARLRAHFIPSTLLPRTLAWLSVDDERVCLLDGYTAASYTPPILFFSSAAIPAESLERLQETEKCTLSAATVREPESAYLIGSRSETPQWYSFADLGIEPAANKLEDYPVAVASSPIHMHCRLERVVDLAENQSMTILVVETFLVDESVLSPPTELMKKTRPDVVAKIDAHLIQPRVGMGPGVFSTMTGLRSMPRPLKNADGNWHSSEFDPGPDSLGPGHYESMEWSFRKHGSACALGYNPTVALVMPRPIGWISIYSKEGRVPHLAPYSFFIDVARGERPMVAFSGMRRNGEIKKDAQKDAEEMGCFVHNTITEPLAVPMNLTAAEMERQESEFQLAGLSFDQALLVDAPVVRETPIHYECRHVLTVDVASFSIVIGEVVGVAVDKGVLSEGDLDLEKLKPVSRLGYADEYGVHAHPIKSG